ncbi:hypothetical protein HYH02_011692 [Chlamydomonas schloesseri]|uniref:Lipoyl synthase, mitochondrial n=1 Tax=Chlamydomonas schloesseri TaxID=2026947 RepID=A0A835T8Y0_9CHLO|nr:hypothetical protein HYH02_011692 [Chlamydomonas schloesseri]|eukprot:KAG2435979.1 hypothetical protein HYH02_011692 [Chlamydomonas schloesseri]
MSLPAALLRAGVPWLASSAQQLGGGLAVAASCASQRLSGAIGASGWAGSGLTRMAAAQANSYSSTSSATQAPAEAAAAVKTAEASTSGVAPAVAVETLRRKLAQGPDFSEFLTGSEVVEKYSVEAPSWTAKKRKPEWMKRNKLPGGDKYTEIKAKLRELKLSTVCEEARCPNLGECWGGGDGHTATATIMLMGDTCTRGCKFCAVKTSKAPPPLDPAEPENVSKAIAAWGLDYVVLTSVDRDDLPDGGASHIASTIRLLKQKTEGRLLVEALVPDFQGDMACVQAIVDSGLDVYAHNIETVERLQGQVRDRRAGWAQSLATLRHAKAVSGGKLLTKSSIMLGCGESREEVVATMRALRDAGVDVVTLGQYMRPTKKHMAVSEFVTPEAFAAYQQIAQDMGFLYVASGPMVRSSYRAGELYITNVLKGRRGEQQGQEQQAEAAAA